LPIQTFIFAILQKHYFNVSKLGTVEEEK